MCTVSFVRANDSIIITSNRHENIRRQNAVKPALYESSDKRIIFPKDPRAGGTWFAATDTGVVCVLLNGAFEKHIPVPPYRKSRGLVLLEIIENEDPRKPLSDSKIVSILQKEGLMLARRTIAKYREELKIPTSNQRKVLF